ncbi:MAG: DUF1499 domain-containing protein [Balneolales bacterium]|nr:DUF1499 domain-containing protein [Balneolales bacterium]
MFQKFVILVSLSFSMFVSNKSEFSQKDENPLPKCPGTPNCVRTSASFSEDSATVMNAFDQALRNLNATNVQWDADSSHINAEFTIPVFGWIDDVTISVQPKTPTESIAYIRSASRVGTWDIWVNPIRVNKLIKRVNKLLSS